MTQEHIVKAYDAEINRLRSMISEMGGLAEAQIADSIKALQQRDNELAEKVIAADKKLDKFEADVEKMTIQMIALRAPIADDLREIFSALKICSMLERIGDYAKNVAKRSLVLTKSETIKPAVIVPQMTHLIREMLKDVLDAYIDRDSEKALAVWQRDKAVDDLYNSLFRELLTYMMENPKLITPSAHLLFIAKNIERIGDHTTNIAEIVYFLVEGEILEESRPKSDNTSYADVAHPNEA